MEQYLGIDVGASSVKYGTIDLANGITIIDFGIIELGNRVSSKEYVHILQEIAASSSSYNAIGIGIPFVCRNGRVDDVIGINMNSDWTLKHIPSFIFPNKKNVFAINDADAAGIGESYRPKDFFLLQGTTIVLTLGTGIGSSILVNGVVSPNTELGLLQLHDTLAEHYAAPSVRVTENLSIRAWANRLNEYLVYLEKIIPANYIILSGGITQKFEEFLPYLKCHAKLVPSYYREKCGVVGAAIFAKIQNKNSL